MPNKKAKPTKRKPKNWKKKADDMWSLVLRMRYKQCEICGRPGIMTKAGNRVGGLNAHHLITRGNLLWRHNLRNGLCLCIHCHKWHKTCSPHGGTLTAVLGFIEWMKINKPKQWAWYEKHSTEHRTPKWTYEEDYNYLKNKLNTNGFVAYDD
jgi:hypothetical protein